jgi:voltage-gated potassium channel
MTRALAIPGRPAGGGLVGRFRLPLALLVATLAWGTIAYVAIEGWSVLDAFYMTVITLTTVGFREVQPLDASGQLLTVSVLLLGVVALFAAVGVSTDLLASGELGRELERRRARRRMEHLRHHFIVCGGGRVGKAAAVEFAQEGVPFVVVERDEEVVDRLEEDGLPLLAGDPSEEAVLLEAGIERARGLVCAVDSDAVNVYITIAARALNPALTIVARASRPASVETLRRAGADRVVSPYALSGHRMAFLSLRPSVVDFIDMVTLAPDLRIEEIAVEEASPLGGLTVGDARAAHPGTSILAVKRPGAELVATPPEDAGLTPGDLVVVVGQAAALESMAG